MSKILNEYIQFANKYGDKYYDLTDLKAPDPQWYKTFTSRKFKNKQRKRKKNKRK